MLAAAAVARADGRPLVTVPLEAIARGLVTDVHFTASPRGIDVPIDGAAHVVLPIGNAEVLELDCASQGIVTVTWASDRDAHVFGPPWRYRRIPERGTVFLDLRQAVGWSSASKPLLRFDGTGRVVITAVRAGALPPHPLDARRSVDRAAFWAPESVGHTTINALTPPLWSRTPRVYLPELLAVAFVAVALAVFACRRRAPVDRRIAISLASATLVAVTLGDAHFLVRFLPLVRPSSRLDADARIEASPAFAPEFGALAALSRRTLGARERVGVMAREEDWFSPQTFCFDLAPRHCVRMRPGEQVHAGISGVERLSSAEIDAIIFFHSTSPIPEGFVPVARVSPSAFVARRP